MDEELSALIDELVSKGASDDEIDFIIQDYRSKNTQQAEKIESPDAVDYAGAGAASFNRGISSLVSGPLKFLGNASDYIDRKIHNVTSDEPYVPQGNFFTAAGEGVDSFNEAVNPYRPEVNETFQQVGEGIGQVAGMIATGGTSGAAGIGTQAVTKAPTLINATTQASKTLGSKAFTPGGLLAATSAANPEWEAAKASGLSDEEALGVMVGNFATSLSEGLPLANALKRLDKLTGGTIVQRLKAAGTGAFEEGIQEAFQQYVSNKIAQGSYDPERDELTQVLQSGKVGAIVGALIPAVGGISHIVKREKQVKDRTIEAKQQAAQVINEVADTGDAQLNAEIDAAGALTPQEESQLENQAVSSLLVEDVSKAVDEVKNVEKQIKEEQKEEAKAEKAKESETPQKVDKTPELVEASPEYQDAVQKLSDVSKKLVDSDLTNSSEMLALMGELQTAKEALRRIAPENSAKGAGKKSEVKTQIEDTTGVTKPEKSIKMTPNEAIKFRVQEFYKGVQEGVYRGKDAVNQLVTKVQEALKDSPLSTKQVSTILTRVKNTNLFTPGSISRLNTFIDKVSQDAEYADKVSQVKALTSKIRKSAKSPTTLQNLKGIARTFAGINPEDVDVERHLDLATKISAGLLPPSNPNYQAFNTAEVQDYISEVQDKQDEAEAVELDAAEQRGETRNLNTFTALSSSIDALQDLDTTDFDDSEKRIVETLKGVDTSTLTDEQGAAMVRVLDNIIENGDFSNASRVETIIASKQNIDKAKKLVEDVKTKEIGVVGKIGANNYQQFTRIFGKQGIASEIMRLLGITDLYNAGSRVENQENKFDDRLNKKLKEIKQKTGTDTRKLINEVRLVAFSELYKNYGDESHIPKVKKNFDRTAKEYAKVDKDKAKAWEQVISEFKDVTSGEEALAVLNKTKGLHEAWKFINDTFNNEIVDRHEKVNVELHNKPYLRANNYTHTNIVNLTGTKEAKESFAEGTQMKQRKVKPSQSSTSIKATRNVPNGKGYSSDFFVSQLKGYKESLYDIEASKAEAQVYETMYTSEFEEIVGGLDNAKVIRAMVESARKIQQGSAPMSSNDAVRFLNKATQFIRTLGATKALASLSQPVKQTTVLAKTFFNHLGSGSIPTFFKAVGSRNLFGTSEGLRKLFDNYTIGVRGSRLGGVERGETASAKLEPSSRQKAVRVAEWLSNRSRHFSGIVMGPLTKSDVYAAQVSWLSYYLHSLKEQGVSNVNLHTEFEKQGEESRQKAAAYAEQMVAETQVPSNPATLAQVVRNENDGGWNLAKTILIPFSTFSINAKYRNVSDVSNFIRNPNARNAGAVAGDAAEMLIYAGIATYVLGAYKDLLKSGIESLFGVDSEDDEEKKATNRKKAFWTNITNGVVPFAIGTAGEYGTSQIANGIAYLAENPDANFENWKKETGGFVFEPKEKIDYGLIALGLEPFKDSADGLIDLTKSKSGKEITYTDAYGKSHTVVLNDNQENLLAVTTIVDLLNTVGISEADVFNQIRKVMKEQLKEAGKPPKTRNRQRIDRMERSRIQLEPKEKLVRERIQKRP